MDAIAKSIVEKFGTQTALAELVGKKQSTVAGWVANGIPTKWQKVLLELAKKHHVNLKAEDFFTPVKVQSDLETFPKATHFGELEIGQVKLPAYVLENGQRVFNLKSISTNLFESSSYDVAEYLKVKALKPFLSNDLIVAENNTIEALIKFDTGNQGIGKFAQGLPVEKFMRLCVAYSKLGDTEQATEKQKQISVRARDFIHACAEIGIIALVDEVTGYQYEREETALQVKLKLFLAEKMREWDKTFPDQLWVEFARLTGWKGDPTKQRPQWWGKLVNELIYGYLDRDVLEWLKANAPKPIHGQNYHQWLTSQYGLNRLISHIHQTIGMAATCINMNELRRIMAERFGAHYVQLSMWLRPE